MDNQLLFYADGKMLKNFAVFCNTAGFVVATQSGNYSSFAVATRNEDLILWSSDVDGKNVSQDHAAKVIAGRYYQATGEFFDTPTTEDAERYVNLLVDREICLQVIQGETK